MHVAEKYGITHDDDLRQIDPAEIIQRYMFQEAEWERRANATDDEDLETYFKGMAAKSRYYRKRLEELGEFIEEQS